MNERLVLFFPPYKKSQFYQLMGAFFAERVYQQQFPYLVNDENCYWYVILDDEKRVTAFSYYEKGANKVELGEFYEKDPAAQFKKFLLRKCWWISAATTQKQRFSLLVTSLVKLHFWSQKGLLFIDKQKIIHF